MCKETSMMPDSNLAERKLTEHIFRYIIAFSIVFPRLPIKNKIRISHDEPKMRNILCFLDFHLDEWDLFDKVLDIPFILCPCRICSKRCDYCNYGDRLFSIKNIQFSESYKNFLVANKINKTYFREISFYLIDYILSSKDNKDNYLVGWTSKQINVLCDLLEYICDTWNDKGKYDDKYECNFPVKEFGYTFAKKVEM